MIALLVIQLFQTVQLYDRKLTQFNARTQTLVERIAIHHEKADDIRKYLQVVNRDFSGQYKDILRKEFQNLLSSRESISIRDTVLRVNGEEKNYLIIKGKSFDTISGLTAEHQVLARDVRQLRQLFKKETGVIPDKDSVNLAIQLDQRVTEQIFKKAKFVNELMIEAFRNNMYSEPSERIDIEFLDSVIAYEVKHNGLPLNYRFMVTDERGNPVKFKFSGGQYQTDLDTAGLAITSLFPQNVLDDKLYLNLDFEGKTSFLFKEMGSMLLLNGVLLLLIVVSISFMFRTILTQKKLSELKNDFISNMTHEFKTPISTISLACEALGDKDMIGEESAQMSQPFVKMISAENKRLEVLVERILQSALIDRGEVKLKEEKLNLAELLRQVVENARFRLESQRGTIQLHLPDEEAYILGDRVHVTNIISNLVDNAIKYSKEEPEIRVDLIRKEHQYELSVADKGIGIPREHVNKIFDKLYRVPTGNVHNVKGFGLGLSYVKAIVDLNKWNIKVKSKLNEGSTFTLIIPE